MIDRHETPRTFEQALLRYRCGPGRHTWGNSGTEERLNCQRCGLTLTPGACEACGRTVSVEEHAVVGPDRLMQTVRVCAICAIGLDGGGLTGWRIVEDKASCAQ